MLLKRRWRMATASRKITVEGDTNLAQLLDEAAIAPVLLEKNGKLFRLISVETETDDIWTNYQPEEAREGIRSAAGSWKDIDSEKAKNDIYRAREEGTRPVSRP
jgi:hypothetical protein